VRERTREQLEASLRRIIRRKLFMGDLPLNRAVIVSGGPDKRRDTWCMRQVVVAYQRNYALHKVARIKRCFDDSGG